MSISLSPTTSPRTLPRYFTPSPLSVGRSAATSAAVTTPPSSSTSSASACADAEQLSRSTSSPTRSRRRARSRRACRRARCATRGVVAGGLHRRATRPSVPEITAAEALRRRRRLRGRGGDQHTRGGRHHGQRCEESNRHPKSVPDRTEPRPGFARVRARWRRRRSSLRGSQKSYGKVHALRGVDLRAEQGSVLGLLGPNGAGKTTAVRILTTLLEADGGSARVAGLDVVKDAKALRGQIGLAGQYAAVDENLTGFENLDMVGRLYHLGKALARERAHELLERFELSDAADRPAKTYSGGMRRRLDLAAALVARPPVLFLDEPTTGPGPAQPRRAVGDDRGARGRGHDRAADHAVPRRGRPARGPDRGDRPRQGDRRGHQRRAQVARRRRAARGRAARPRARGRRRSRRSASVCDGVHAEFPLVIVPGGSARSPTPCARSTRPA